MPKTPLGRMKIHLMNDSSGIRATAAAPSGAKSSGKERFEGNRVTTPPEICSCCGSRRGANRQLENERLLASDPILRERHAPTMANRNPPSDREAEAAPG